MVCIYRLRSHYQCYDTVSFDLWQCFWQNCTEVFAMALQPYSLCNCIWRLVVPLILRMLLQIGYVIDTDWTENPFLWLQGNYLARGSSIWKASPLTLHLCSLQQKIINALLIIRHFNAKSQFIYFARLFVMHRCVLPFQHFHIAYPSAIWEWHLSVVRVEELKLSVLPCGQTMYRM